MNLTPFDRQGSGTWEWAAAKARPESSVKESGNENI